MKITDSQLRKIIRRELLAEVSLAKKPSTPVPLEDLQFIPGSTGDMALPGVGAYKMVRNPEALEAWKVDFLGKYGPTMISWDHNGWHVENNVFQSEMDMDKKMYLDYERDYESRYGRKPSLGT